MSLGNAQYFRANEIRVRYSHHRFVAYRLLRPSAMLHDFCPSIHGLSLYTDDRYQFLWRSALSAYRKPQNNLHILYMQDGQVKYSNR